MDVQSDLSHMSEVTVSHTATHMCSAKVANLGINTTTLLPYLVLGVHKYRHIVTISSLVCA